MTIRCKACLFVLGIPCLALLLLQGESRHLSSFQKAWKSATATTTTPSTKSDHPQRKPFHQEEEPKIISLVVPLRGEMANILSRLVFAKGIQWWVQEHYYDNTMDKDLPSFQVDVIGERQEGTSKWKTAVRDLQQCFPKLRTFDFQGGKWDPDFQARQAQQESLLAEWEQEIAQNGKTQPEHYNNNNNLLMIDRADSDCGETEWFCLHQQLAFLRSILAKMNQEQKDPSLANHTTTTNNRYSLPYLTSTQMSSFDVIVDQYYPKIQQWLAFDYDACCGPVQPHAEEVVFHLRNFRGEMRQRNYLQRGYEELNPHQVAHELLGHLPDGNTTRIAIVSRGQAYVDLYKAAMEARGWIVRTTPDDYTGVQDFCFLLQTQRELVGTMRSTYTRWAALLGQAKRVQLYSIDSPSTRKAHFGARGTSSGNNNTHEEEADFVSTLHYPWKRLELQTKIVYRVFQSNETLP